MKRALLVTSSFPRHSSDSAGVFLVPLCRALMAHMHVEVLAPRGTGLTDNAISDVRVHRAPYAPRALETLFYGAGAPVELAAHPVRGAAMATTAVASLAAHIRAIAPDVVFAHWLVPAGLAARMAGLPYSLYCHGSDVALLERMPGGKALARFIAAGAISVCAPSESLAQRVERLTRSKVQVLPLPVERGERVTVQRRFNVGYLGRLIAQKGVHILVEAAANAGLSVLIAGDGPLRSVLDRPNIVSCGPIAPDARARFFSAIDVLVVPSLEAEGSPAVIAEAAMHDVPTIGSRVPGITDVLTEDSLVEPGNVRELGEALARACSDEAWRARAIVHARKVADERRMDVLGARFASVLDPC